MLRRVVSAGLAVGLIGLAGCDGIPGTPGAEASAAVRKQMIDPDAAKIKIMGVTDQAVCGTVNGKNRMGAYVGQNLFVFDRLIGSVETFQDPPSISDYRMVQDSRGSEQLDHIHQLTAACDFPTTWKSNCGPGLASFPVPTDVELCDAWKKNDYGKLRDLAGSY